MTTKAELEDLISDVVDILDDSNIDPDDRIEQALELLDPDDEDE